MCHIMQILITFFVAHVLGENQEWHYAGNIIWEYVSVDVRTLFDSTVQAEFGEMVLVWKPQNTSNNLGYWLWQKTKALRG